MNILAIDTSCDETAVAIVNDVTVLSNVIWSQASLHAKWGGIHPSLAQREHEKKIEWVIEKAIRNSQLTIHNINVVAVTVGPGLAMSLQVGIHHAKKLAKKLKLPLIAVNHIEGHVLSSLAKSPKGKRDNNFNFPAFGLVVSGGTTQLIFVEEIGKYKIIAQTADDALGEALDKAARMLGLGYPGGAVLEKMAKEGNPDFYNLPIPMLGQEKEKRFSYSGLKTAMWRLTESEKQKGRLSKTKIQNLAASFQDKAFQHLIRVTTYAISSHQKKCEVKNLLIGGGVGANIELRKRLRKMARKLNIKVHCPYSKRLYTDNAAMVGIAAYFKYKRGWVVESKDFNLVDREPRAKVDEGFEFEKK